MQNLDSTAPIEREDGAENERMDALGRLFARRPVHPTSEKLLRVGEVEDGADVDADEMEVAGTDDD